ncbi:MAG: helix-hairpin-helix domain-containing protein, partial [Chloroflexota bacterium]
FIGFAEYGFCKSHAAAFAKTAYDTAYLKVYFAPEFYAALLNNEPMGFYSPEVVVGDAKRHGVKILPVDVSRSGSRCEVEDGNVRLGFQYVAGLGEATLRRLERARAQGPYRSPADFRRRTGLDRKAMENLIAVGAFDSFDVPRRRLLWELGLQENERDDQPGLGLRPPSRLPVLPALSRWEEVAMEYELLGLPVGSHILETFRPELEEMGVLRSDELAGQPPGVHLTVAGLLVCRQAPPTAKGHVFLTLEDEAGLVNVILRPAVHQQYYLLVRTSPALIIEGNLQYKDGVVNVLGNRVFALARPASVRD